MNTEVIKSPVEVANALARLGFKREHFDEVIARMVTARNSCTENHPTGAGGYAAYSEGTCRLREVATLVGGWMRNNDNFIASIYNAELNVKIAVCNTDDATGIEDRLPQNRNKKGSGLDELVGDNQTVFQSILDAANVIPISRDASGRTFWYLCVHCDGKVVRAELSCPSDCDGGFFKSFRKRIILIGADDNDGTGVRRRGDSPEGSPEFEIVVIRKQA